MEEIPELRRRDDKLDEYLKIWDLREGWFNDQYECSREQTLREIAQELGISLTTAANRYRSAFHMIIGCDYSPEVWARVFGIFKIAEFLAPDEVPRRSLRRPWRNFKSRLVPESVLQQSEQHEAGNGILGTLCVCQNEITFTELILDIKDLLAQGRSNDEITAVLDFTSPEAFGIIEHIRQRQHDTL